MDGTYKGIWVAIIVGITMIAVVAIREVQETNRVALQQGFHYVVGWTK